ncbi:MAG TPA: flavin prenyltransferase UbiX [Pseudomonadales bacterium]
MDKPARVTLAITGASGSAYALRLLQCLAQQSVSVDLLVSEAAREVMRLEMDLMLPDDAQLAVFLSKHLNIDEGHVRVWSRQQWTSPVASGSSAAGPMVICPCSTGTLSAIACGASNSLIERAADVSIKERRPLILVPRETPLSAIHLENMLKLSRLGVTVLPAMPGFYHHPQSVADMVDFIVARILSCLGVPQTLLKPWGGDTP